MTKIGECVMCKDKIKLSVLKYKEKEVGYRLEKGASKVDVSKDDFDSFGGVDYSSISYIDLISSGNLIASNEEISSGNYVVQVTDKAIVGDLYADYIDSLGNYWIGDKYVLKVCDDVLFKCIEVYKLGQKELFTCFYTAMDYKDIMCSVEDLCKDIGLSGVDVEDYGNSATIMVDGVTLHSLDYDNDIDLLLYNVRYLVLKLIKTMSSGVVC